MHAFFFHRPFSDVNQIERGVPVLSAKETMHFSGLENLLNAFAFRSSDHVQFFKTSCMHCFLENMEHLLIFDK